MDEAELDAIYSFAVQLGKDAGQLLLEAAQGRYVGGQADAHESGMKEKESAVDIVTQTDEDIEAFITQQIRSRFPHHHLVAEESYSKGQSKRYLIDDNDDVGTWCIDPLDGTVNFAHAFPMACVSIAFVWKGKPVVGVVSAPFLHQLYSACQGRGAYLNETQRLPLVAPTPPLPPDAPKGCTFCCEFGKDRRDLPDGNLHRKVESFVNMAAELGGRNGKGGMVHGIRCLGSAALDLCYTATGAFDIWWEGGCWEWDVAAGICLLQESGGLVTTANPPPNPTNAPVEDAKLGGRLYLAVRAAGDTANETGRQAQERLIREVWRRVRKLDYTRPAV